MKRLGYILVAMFAALSFAACNPDNGIEGGIDGPKERITFELKSTEPIVASPDEEITYKFTISYKNGLASVHTSLNGQIIEGSEMDCLNAPAVAEAAPEEDAPAPAGPTQVDYTFKYTVKDSQFGETLDFVFTATGVDGYTQSVDYAVWVTANAVEFTVLVPEGQPESIYSDVNLKFNVKVECGNILKSFVVKKSGAAYDSFTNFTDQKNYTYNFNYTPATEDIGKTVEFSFVATDVKGNSSEALYSVAIIKADAVAKMLWSDNFNTTMSISTTTAFNTTEGGISGGGATQFDKTNVVKYGTLFTVDAETGEQVAVTGALEGCEVYDGDKSALTYTSDGVDVCLSKYGPNGETSNMSGCYAWYRKAKKGWIRVDGIKLHGATSLKLTYSQANGNIKVDYSIDGGATWNEVGATSGGAETNEFKFNIAAGAETISLKFNENDGTAHARIDNLKLVEVL